MVFSEALHKSNVRIQKRKYKYSYLKIRSKKGNIDKKVYMILIRRLKTKKSEMFQSDADPMSALIAVYKCYY